MKTLFKMLLVIFIVWPASNTFSQACQAYFTATTSGLFVQLTDSSRYSPNANSLYNKWTFGDGQTSGWQQAGNATHTYTSPGTYTVCDSVMAFFNGTLVCQDVYCTQVTVSSGVCGSIPANFTTTGFTNGFYVVANNAGAGYLYEWYVMGPTPSHVNPNTNTAYQFGNLQPGTYNVCLYIWANATTFCDSVCQTVVVQGQAGNCAPNAAFTYTYNSGTLVLQASGVPQTYPISWQVGSASSSVSVGNNPYTFANISAGTQNICLLVYANSITAACDTVCQTVVLQSSGCNVNAGFQWTQGLVNNVYNFTSSTNTGTHVWYVNGSPFATTANPVYTFPTDSSTITYNVCHVISISGTICADTVCQPVIVPGVGGNPCAGFSVSIGQSTNPNGVTTLTATTSGGTSPYFYSWSNGTTTQTITTQTAGAYCVTVYDNRQCSAVSCDSVGTNSGGCQSSFSFNVLPGGQVLFYGTPNSSNVTTWVWNFGDGSSGTGQNPVHTYTQPGVYTACLVITTANGCSNTSCQTIVISNQTATDTICGVVFNDLNNNGIQDAGEPGIPGAFIRANTTSGTYSDSSGYYQLIVPAGTYTIFYCSNTGYIFSIPVNSSPSITNGCATYTVNATGGGAHCGYNFGVYNNSVQICGTVYFDANNNGVQDANTEFGIANAQVQLLSNGAIFTTFTDQNGNYCIFRPAGNYTIRVAASVYQGGSVNPTSITLAATTVGTVYSNNNFGVYFQPGSCNLAVNLTPHTTVTAGFQAWYDVVVTNVGSSVTSGTLNMFYDPTLVFNYSSPAQTSHNASTRTLSWSLTNLYPGQQVSFWVNFNALTTTAIGYQAFNLVNVITSNCNDVNLNNNVDTVHQIATASWDPNNKLVEPIGEGADGKIRANQEMFYTINFQNTGTAPAVNVVLHDDVETTLDLSTFRMLEASHPYVVQIDGREIIWRFSNIMLPDSTSDEPNSHGYVRFAINQTPDLVQGTQITNTAAIYFDFNEPVITNTALNTIDYSVSVENLESGNVVIALQPNPFKDFTTVKVNGLNDVELQLSVINLLGEVVHTEKSTAGVFNISRGNLPSGIYLFEVKQHEKTIGKGKMIAE